MTIYSISRAGQAIALLAVMFATPVYAQQPSATALANAKEIITIKGATKIFDPIVPGVIEQARLSFLQTNPMIGKDLNDVATELKAEYASRTSDISNEVARLYASAFTEQELKDAVAFYKSPLGKKMVDEEPKILDQSMSYGQDWANKLSEEIMTKMRTAMKKKGHDI